MEPITYTLVFFVLLLWRYVHQVVHLVSFWLLYRPALPHIRPTYRPDDVTVLMPTVSPSNEYFVESLLSIVRNRPASLLIIAPNAAICAETRAIVTDMRRQIKRLQLLYGIRTLETPLVALVDDHVMWKTTFLRYALAAFEDGRVGLVGTNKRGIREYPHRSLRHRVINMIQCLYLERHNFDICSSNAVDGSVFVISGRTALLRSTIVTSPDFVHAYGHDCWFFGRIGPMAVDDDNFVTRWCVRHHWRVKVQYMPETLVTTSLGSTQKFSDGLIRWARTAWRSKATTLSQPFFWRAQPWSIYAVCLLRMTNFALFYDVALFYALAHSTLVQDEEDSEDSGRRSFTAYLTLALWIISFKMIKPFAYFWRYPQDIILIPAYFLFTYVHSFIKLCALFTVWDVSWSGRNLDDIQVEPIQEEMATNSMADRVWHRGTKAKVTWVRQS